MSDITLSKAVRSNLLNLQSTAIQMGKTQERLSSGMKVNSALDNPTNFFTASALNSRASDLNQLMDSVGSAVQTIAAADKGIKAITKLVESAQSVARQALQSAATVVDPDSAAALAINAVVTGGTYSAPVATTPHVDGTATGGTYAAPAADETLTINGDDVLIETTDDITEAVAKINGAGITGVTAAEGTGTDAGKIIITNTGGNVTITGAGGAGFTTASTSTNYAAGSADGDETLTINGTDVTIAEGDDITAAIGAINALTTTHGAVASEGTGADAGKIVLTSTTRDIAVTSTGADFLGTETGDFVAGTAAGQGTIANPKREELREQYNELLNQIDQLAKDSGFNGVNLLQGDDLDVIFNEDGTSNLSIKGIDLSSGNAAKLNLQQTVATDFDDNDSIKTTLDSLKAGIETLRTESSKFGSNLSVVENRQSFTKNMVNVLQTGAANLTLADTNEEAANLLALQTRQQLSSTALSMASQADQQVLQLF